jgi:hypothetical protein
VTELNQVQPPIETIARRYPGFDWRVYDRTLCAFRTATHKYIQGSDGREELYALADDPGETEDRAAAEPARTAEMRGRLAACARASRRRPPPPPHPSSTPRSGAASTTSDTSRTDPVT